MSLPSQTTAAIINKFRSYRGDLPWTPEEIRDNYQVEDLIPPPLFKPPAPDFTVLLPPPVPVAANPALSKEEQAFINSAPPDLEDAAQTAIFGGLGNWRGKKFLGSGTFGYAGLWEYRRKNPKDMPFRQVVVKESSEDEPGDLRDEGDFLTQLRVTKSQHIAHILSDPQRVDVQAEGIDASWDNHVRRLIMEYCPLGDLADLIMRFESLGRHIRETTLWRIFECLVDGITVLEVGNDWTVSNEPEATPRPDWGHIVHFDLKPSNILLGEDRLTHFTSPVCKIGDFGLAWPYRSDATWRRKFELRERGTPTFFAPEQFSESWEAADFGTLGVAGLYEKSNIWGIGCIMYCLVLMHYQGPDPREPFTPRWKLNSETAKGRTFGLPLRGQSPHYSRALTDLIQECLYEQPGHRPDLKELKTRVQNGWKSAFKADATLDAWEDFLPRPPPPPERERRFCKGTCLTGKACKKKPIVGGYCAVHQGQRP